mmetsp:Transcript_10195/g.30634  ORF Transcript_10195/g.30634 Transcript_10195/m.30634 type:complete len:290 (+) Transcript_10195:1119-1988(+)
MRRFKLLVGLVHQRAGLQVEDARWIIPADDVAHREAGGGHGAVEDRVLDVQEVQDPARRALPALAPVRRDHLLQHGHAEVRGVEDLVDQPGVERRRQGHAGRVLQGGHHLLHAALLQPQGPHEQLGLKIRQRPAVAAGLRVQVDQMTELGGGEDLGELLAQHAVQELGRRVGQRGHHHHEEHHYEPCVVAYGQTIARTDGLRDDLAHDHDAECRHDAANQAARHFPKEDRQHCIHSRVAQKKRAQQEVARLAYRKDCPRPPCLTRSARAHCEFKAHLVERHEPKVQPRK